MKNNKLINSVKCLGIASFVSAALILPIPIAVLKNDSFYRGNLKENYAYSKKLSNLIKVTNIKNDKDFHNFLNSFSATKEWKSNHKISSLRDILKSNKTDVVISKNRLWYKKHFFTASSETTITFNYPKSTIFVDGEKYTLNRALSMNANEMDEAMNRVSTRNPAIKLGAILTMPDNSKFTWGVKNNKYGWLDFANNMLGSFGNYWNHWKSNSLTIKKVNNNHYFALGRRDPLYVNEKTWNQITSENQLYKMGPLPSDNNKYATNDNLVTGEYWTKMSVNSKEYIDKSKLISSLGSSPEEKYFYNNNAYQWEPLSTVTGLLDLSSNIQKDLSLYINNKEKKIDEVISNLLKKEISLKNSYIKIKDESETFNKQYNAFKNADTVSYTKYYYLSVLLKFKFSKNQIDHELEKIKILKDDINNIWNSAFSKTFETDIINGQILYNKVMKKISKKFKLALTLKNKNFREVTSIFSVGQHLKSSFENKVINVKKDLIFNLAIEKQSLVGNSKTFVSFKDNMDVFRDSHKLNYMSFISEYLTDAEKNHVSIDEMKKWFAKNPLKNYWYNHNDKNIYNQAGSNLFIRSTLGYFFKVFKKGKIRYRATRNPLLSEILNKIRFTNMGSKEGYALSYEKNISKNISLQLVPTVAISGKKSFMKRTGYVKWKGAYWGYNGRPINSFATFMVIAKNGYILPGGTNIHLGEKDSSGNPITTSALFITKTVEPNLKFNVSKQKRVVKETLDKLEEKILGKRIAIHKQIDTLNEYSSGYKFFSLLSLYKRFLNKINLMKHQSISNQQMSYSQKMKIFSNRFSTPFNDGVKPKLYIDNFGKTYIVLSIKNENNHWISKTISINTTLINQIKHITGNLDYAPNASNFENSLKEYPWFPKEIMHVYDSEDIEKREYIHDMERRLQNDADNHFKFWKMLKTDKQNWEYYQIRDFLKSPQHIINVINATTSLEKGEGELISNVISMLPVLGELQMIEGIAASIVDMVENGITMENALELSINIGTLGFEAVGLGMEANSKIRTARSNMHTFPSEFGEFSKDHSLKAFTKKMEEAHDSSNIKNEIRDILPWDEKFDKTPSSPSELTKFFKEHENAISANDANSIYNIFKSEMTIHEETKLFLEEDVLNSSYFLEKNFNEVEGAVGGSEETVKEIVNHVKEDIEKNMLRDLGKGGAPTHNPSSLDLLASNSWGEAIFKDMEEKVLNWNDDTAISAKNEHEISEMMKLFDPASETRDFDDLKNGLEQQRNNDRWGFMTTSYMNFERIKNNLLSQIKFLRREISWRFAMSWKFNEKSLTSLHKRIKFIDKNAMYKSNIFMPQNLTFELNPEKEWTASWKDVMTETRDKFLNDIVRLQYIMDRLSNFTSEGLNWTDEVIHHFREFIKQRSFDMAELIEDKKTQIKVFDDILGQPGIPDGHKPIFAEMALRKRVGFYRELIQYDQTLGRNITGDLTLNAGAGIGPDRMGNITMDDLLRLDQVMSFSHYLLQERGIDVAKDHLLFISYLDDIDALSQDYKLLQNLKTIFKELYPRKKSEFYKDLIKMVPSEATDSFKILKSYYSVFSKDISSIKTAFEKLAEALNVT